MAARRIWRTGLLAGLACCIAAGLGAGAAGGRIAALDGLLYDSGLAILARLAPGPARSNDSAAVVVAVDSRTLDDPELRRYPRALFAPVWVETLDLLAAAGAQAIVFDFIFDYSARALAAGDPEIDRYFDRQFDRPFLAALARHQDKIVIGRSESTLPLKLYQAALGFDPASLAMLEVPADADGVYRRVPLRTVSDGAALPGAAAAALERAGRPVETDAVLLAPRRKLENLPTYSLVDVLGCGRRTPETLRQAFAGKFVFIGSTQPIEDRKRAADRFMPSAVGGPVAGVSCLVHRGASDPQSETIPGVYLHAAAADALTRGRLTIAAPAPLVAAVAAAGAGAGAGAGLVLAPWLAALAVSAGGVLLFVGSVALLAGHFYLPVGWALGALLGGASIAYVVRFLVEDRRRRRVQTAFSHYLSPHIVDRLVDETTALRLGGERRDVTMMFADLSGFTALSEKVSPEMLVTETNRYLKLIVDEVEATGGYVDKFIGDAVMAMWGAPVEDARHATNAVKAALQAEARIAETARDAAAADRPVFSVKIGINSGPAVVGNVGTDRRFNYTAVGETVNVASRLEGVVGVYRAGIVVGEATRERVGDTVPFRELDRITVKGKTRPLVIFRPYDDTGAAAEQRRLADEYAAALASYRERRFDEAERRWRALAATDGPASVMADRAAAFAAMPPPDDWQGDWILTSK